MHCKFHRAIRLCFTWIPPWCPHYQFSLTGIFWLEIGVLCLIQFLHVHASLRYKEVIVKRIASLLIIRFDRSRWTGWRGTLSSRSGQRCWKYLSLGYVWYTGNAKAHSNKLRESRWELSKESFMFNQRICWRLATFRFNTIPLPMATEFLKN